MKFGFWRAATAGLLALSSCGGSVPTPYLNNSSPPNTQAPTASPALADPAAPTPVANIQMGNIQRTFFSQNTVSCSIDLFGEGLFIFNDPQSSSSLSVRLRDVQNQRTQRWLSPKKGAENILIALGGDANQNHFQMQGNAETNCSVKLERTPPLIQGSFQCKHLVNAEGSGLGASGNFSCQLQPEKDWNW